MSVSNRIPISDDVARKGAAMFGIALDGTSTVDLPLFYELQREVRRAQTHEPLIIVYADGEIETGDYRVIKCGHQARKLLRRLKSGAVVDKYSLFAAACGDGEYNYGTLKTAISRANTAIAEYKLLIEPYGEGYRLIKV